MAAVNNFSALKDSTVKGTLVKYFGSTDGVTKKMCKVFLIEKFNLDAKTFKNKKNKERFKKILAKVLAIVNGNDDDAEFDPTKPEEDYIDDPSDEANEVFCSSFEFFVNFSPVELTTELLSLPPTP